MSVIQDFSALRHHLSHRLLHARRQSDALFQAVRPNSLYERPIPERHRIVFYIGHLEAFDWNLLHDRVLGLKSFRTEFDKLFAFGIDPVGGGLPNDQPSDWPSIEQVNEYVATIRRAIDENLENRISESDFDDRPINDRPINDRLYEGFPLGTLLNVAIEHRLMHVETLSYMLHQLSLDRKIPHDEQTSFTTVPITARMLEIPAGEVTLGLARENGEFGWDNEFEKHTVDVPALSIDEYKVTNRQFAEFIAAGGYENRSLWSDNDGDGDWEWKNEQKVTHPVFWRRNGDQWMYRTMFNEIPLPADWPVYVSQAEAKAYAKWVGKSLPTEPEWQRAANGLNKVASVAQFSDLRQADPHRWNPSPVNASTADSSVFGVRDMYGNGWEWTSTVFSPFRGFEPFPFYRGYSADFFDGKHFVMKGGSPRTATCMLRPTFRNWFQAHYQYVYAGFRCVSR